MGGQTFAVNKWPVAQFGTGHDWEKYWRRKNITLAQGRRVQEKATLAASVGIECNFWGGQIETRYAKTPPTVQLFGETPGSFPARNWTVADGRGLMELDVDNARDVCVLGSGLAKTVFPFGSPVGDHLKINGINYSVVGVLEPKGGSLGGDQDNFAVVPITTALNRFGRWWWSLRILVQARDAASYDDTVEQVRGIMRVARKVPPDAEDDFEIFSNDSIIAQFNNFTKAVRIGVTVVSSIALLAAGIGPSERSSYPDWRLSLLPYRRTGQLMAHTPPPQPGWGALGCPRAARRELRLPSRHPLRGNSMTRLPNPPTKTSRRS